MAALTQTATTGVTPLYLAVERGYLGIVKILVTALKGNMAALTQTTKSGVTPLYIATQYGYLEIVKILVTELHGNVAALTQATMSGVTPLYLAAERGYLEIVKILVNALKDNIEAINQETSDATAIYIAAYRGHTKIVEILLNNNAVPEKTAVESVSNLLTLAKASNCEEKLRALFAKHNIQKKLEGFTPLYVAIVFEYTDIVKLLLEHGVSLKSAQGITVYELAEAMQSSRLLAIIELPTKVGIHKFSGLSPVIRLK